MKRKNYELLQRNNQQVTSALAEKELLLKEIHHRVKNNLQIISGLLYWQSKQTKDKQLKHPVKEGKNLLKSMAMIHETLYQGDNLKNIAIYDYIRELATEFLATYGLDQSETSIKLNIDPLHLDVDIMTPLGLL